MKIVSRMRGVVSAACLAVACGHSPPSEPAAPGAAAPETAPAPAPAPTPEVATPMAAPEPAESPVALTTPVAAASIESAPPAPPEPAKPAPTKASSKAAPEPPSKGRLAAEQPIPPMAPSATDDPCHATKFNFSAISKACKDGGRKAARVTMKGAVNRAKAAGTDLKCSGCHVDTTNYGLKANAIADMKPWL